MNENNMNNLPEEEKSKKQLFWELARFTILAIVIVVPIRVFIAQPFIVSGSSMVPTFEDKQYLIVDEISYRLEDPERGDVVIFRNPQNTKVFFIKRIIGLPNETVEIKGNDIKIINNEHIDGFKLEQPYVKNLANNDIRFELGENEYYVMGDNRSASNDSRYWGPVDKKLLIGRAFLRLFPINKIDFMPGDYKQVE